ncbi:hypothetical protein KDL44_03890 [bacterium]|nr:hypothetical protein [bacterium]
MRKLFIEGAWAVCMLPAACFTTDQPVAGSPASHEEIAVWPAGQPPAMPDGWPPATFLSSTQPGADCHLNSHPHLSPAGLLD